MRLTLKSVAGDGGLVKVELARAAVSEHVCHCPGIAVMVATACCLSAKVMAHAV